MILPPSPPVDFLRSCLQCLGSDFYHVTRILSPPHLPHHHQTIADWTRSGHLRKDQPSHRLAGNPQYYTVTVTEC